MIRTRVAAAVAVLAAGLLALSACGQTVGGQARPAQQLPAAARPAAREQPQAAGVRLAAAQVGNLGAVITDQNGRTLYRFDRDRAKPPASNCVGDCAKTWLPVTVTDLGEVQLSDVDRKLVGVVARADGTKQLTLNSWPLYRYSGDRAAGDARGQGVGGTWFAVTPQGKKAEAAPAAADAGGY